MRAVILDFCDTLEESIRTFLAANPEGGQFDLPPIDGFKIISIPAMIGMLECEGFDVEYDCNVDTDKEWLTIKKVEMKALSNFDADMNALSRFDDDAYGPFTD